ncbi:putative lipoprotein [Leptospira sp. Fiocruz LV3954]|nr:putative lipoprotein [Leptospira sp. Fiocruz LV3954]EMI62479.1 putative lipoprotein [Leptospira sp. Fiocruz LV4135]
MYRNRFRTYSVSQNLAIFYGCFEFLYAIFLFCDKFKNAFFII